MTPSLTGLCEALAASIIGDDRRISLQAVGQAGSATSRAAESLGLIATELVMNALKHAFPGDDAEGRIVVSYEVAGTGWKLAVSDNGIGQLGGGSAQAEPGLGTGIVKALSRQLAARVETVTGPAGTTVSITHAAISTAARSTP